ncbi:MAG: NADPH:quinone reductase [Gammaproteobacteria bacterium]|nr:NADPH:quinone reductase [Gammaproteobacteria bacterium]
MNIPKTMRAAFIRATGGIEQVEIGELPVPRVGPTDVLVRMEASEVNHVDLFVRSGAYRTHMPFPFVLGRDLVGTVIETGSGVASFRADQRVWCNSLGHHGRQGAFAEYAVVAEDRLYPLPEGVDPIEAVAVLHTAATAHIALVREAGLQAGETVFIEGGSGGVGSAAVQMARGSGAQVIATAAPEHAAWVRELGAHAVFDYHLGDVYARVREAATHGIDVWCDTSGHNNFAQCLPLLAIGGRAVVMSGLQRQNPLIPVGELYTRDITLYGFAISNASIDDLSGAAAGINRLLASGKLKTRIGARFRLADAAAAHAAMASGRVQGRIVVVP